MKIAILGAGHGGTAAAGDLALKGHEIRLYEAEEFSESFAPIRKSKEVIINENGEKKTAQLADATHNPGEAISGAELVLVIVPAFAQKSIAQKCAPYFSNDQYVFLIPGGFGSYIFSKELARAGVKPVLGETATLPYGTRKTGGNEVSIFIRTIFNPFAAFPSTQNETASRLLKELYPEIETMENVLDVALNNTNPCVHPVPTVLSASRIEYAGDNFWLYREAMTPSIWRVMRKVDEERIQVRKGFGFGDPHCRMPEETGRVFADQFGYEGIKAGRQMKGPEKLDHRYITEDVPMGLVFYSDMGKLVNVGTPTVDAIIELSSQLLERDFRAEGRNLEFLGLEGYEANALLRELQ